MGEIHYMISEAAKDVGVETHVLRYWEEELELSVGRTEMGHRYYTEDDIQLFKCIRKLKDEGVLLKELKILIPDIQKAKQFKRLSKEENTTSHILEKKSEKKVEKKTERTSSTMLEQALRKNNKVLEDEICKIMTKSLKTEMAYLLDAKEQLEEDRYRRLDTLIRQQQIQRKEASRRGIGGLMKHAIGWN
ncbi:MAG: helix-turn-helix domain-containing protein [Eubacteriales bacterium]